MFIEQRQIPESEGIQYRKRYLRGQVKDVIESSFLVFNEDAYDEAKKLLDQRYGNLFVIANGFRDKLENWPKINSRGGIRLRRFRDFLKQYHTTMQSIGSLNILCDNRGNNRLLSKLSVWLGLLLIGEGWLPST
jgi:hypothetical protein